MDSFTFVMVVLTIFFVIVFSGATYVVIDDYKNKKNNQLT